LKQSVKLTVEQVLSRDNFASIDDFYFASLLD